MKTCLMENCNSKSIAKGLCHKHYGRLKRNNNLEKKFNKDKTCRAEKCTRQVFSKGLCQKHYMRQARRGDYRIVKRYKEVKAA